MNPIRRFFIIFIFGFVACLVAGWISFEPMNGTSDSFRSIQVELDAHRSRAAHLDHDEAQSIQTLIERLEQSEDQAEARRDRFFSSIWIHVLISLICTAIASALAVTVTQRWMAPEVRPRVKSALAPHPAPPREKAAAAAPRLREANSPGDFIFAANADGELTSVNEVISTTLGRPPEELLGESIHQLFGRHDTPDLLRVVARLSPDHPTAHLEVESIHSGEAAPSQWTIHARFDPLGELREIVGYGRHLVEEDSPKEDSSISAEIAD